MQKGREKITKTNVYIHTYIYIYIINIYNIYIYFYTCIYYTHIHNINIYIYITILFSMYDPFQVKVMHCTLGISNQWKWPINKEIWYEKVAWKIAPPKI